MGELKKDNEPVVMIVDDVPQNIQVLASMLSEQGCRIASALGGEQAINMCKEIRPTIILLDIMMPDVDGVEVLKHVKENYPEISVVMITAKHDSETIVECMKYGAEDYLTKPLDSMRTLTVVKHLLKLHQLMLENKNLSSFRADILESPESFSNIKTRNPQMISVFQYVEKVAMTEQPILITGEIGVGKDLMAEAIHKSSGRKGDFIAVNVGALDDDSFVESLFGHSHNMDSQKSGMVEKASYGTLYLDKIGDLSEVNQAKLLRLLQANEYLPVGADVSKTSKARIVLSTNKELETLVADGSFREDLYYCLTPHTIHLPPLRENKADVDVLLSFFLNSISEELGKKAPTYPRELPILLKSYYFPGNIRELKGIAYEAIVRHTGRMLSMQVFKDWISKNRKQTSKVACIDLREPLTIDSFLSALETLPDIKELSNKLIVEAMNRSNSNQEIAASQLGLSRPALYQRLKRDNLMKKVK